MYWLYDLATRGAAPLAEAALRLPWLSAHRERLGLLDREVLERLGGRPVLWVHAASVGEILAAVPLLRAARKRFPGHALLVSTTSLTGREIARRHAPADAAVLLPLDSRRMVTRVLDAVRPHAFVLLETEIWPNLLRELDARGIPAVLLSGRVSPRAFSRYRRIRGVLREAFAHVRFFGMQSEADAGRIRALGAPADRVAVTGSLKLDLGVPAEALGIEGEGPVWLAGSTHAGEEEACIAVFRRLHARFPRLRLLLAPRHLDRLKDVERILEEAGIPWVRRSRVDGAWSGSPDVLLLDTLGELAGLYAHATVAFVGGTLVPVGGHNLLEPARAGAPVLFGPHVDNVVEMARALEASGGGRRVEAGEALEREIGGLLEDPERRAAMARAARETFPAGDVAARSLDAAAPFLGGEAR